MCVCGKVLSPVCVCACVCVVACFCQMGGLKWPAGCCSMPWTGAGESGSGEGKGGNSLAAGISYIDLLMSGMHYLPHPLPHCHTGTLCFYFFVHKCRHIGSGWRGFAGAAGRGCSDSSSSTFLTASISYFQFCMCNFNAGGDRERASKREWGTAVRAACL